MNIVFKVHLKVYKQKISTILLNLQIFQGLKFAVYPLYLTGNSADTTAVHRKPNKKSRPDLLFSTYYLFLASSFFFSCFLFLFSGFLLLATCFLLPTTCYLIQGDSKNTRILLPNKSGQNSFNFKVIWLKFHIKVDDLFMKLCFFIRHPPETLIKM